LFVSNASHHVVYLLCWNKGSDSGPAFSNQQPVGLSLSHYRLYEFLPCLCCCIWNI